MNCGIDLTKHVTFHAEVFARIEMLFAALWQCAKTKLMCCMEQHLSGTAC